MLPQDALTSVESKVGKGLVVLNPGVAAGFHFGFALGEFSVVDVDDGEAVFAFRGDGQSANPALMHGVQRVIDDLDADLEQLVGVSADQQHVLRKLDAHFEVQTLPLRLREFDGGAQQGVEIDGDHRDRALFGETQQTGN